ncbi:MAG: tRNA 2-thiouridine(34) synthase MnmA [Cetobacterium sp.]|uniref:tRNA 2-thiouridine(34) synthase MnmA n=1 Tax=Cetobacterium sp. TaxID=2071632 RepID=UPI003F35A90E
MNKKRIVLGMSGGVDSSTSAYMLKEDGFEVIGVTLVVSKEQRESQDLKDAIALAKELEIEHIILDIVDEFNEKIVKYFVDEYSKGMTPSPCVVCDEIIKMKKLIETANLKDAYYIGTGHYCEVSRDNRFNKSLFKKPADTRKDQGYMLYRIDSEIIDRMIFPLAKYEKTLVREKAKSYGAKVHDKKDSQGICFAKEGYLEFLKKALGDKIKPGNFVDNSGKILGQHQGYQLYTIGQRRGLGVLFPKIYFIIDIIPEKNEIILGDYIELYRKKVELEDFKTQIPFETLLEMRVFAKPRFSSLGFYGKVIKENQKIYFEYDEENPQNAKGQHLVIYSDDLVIGGGKIIF